MRVRSLYVLLIGMTCFMTSCFRPNTDVYVQNRSDRDSIWTIVEVDGRQAFNNWVPKHRSYKEGQQPQAKVPRRRLVHVFVLLPFLHDTAEAYSDLPDLHQVRVVVTTVEAREHIKIIFDDK